MGGGPSCDLNFEAKHYGLLIPLHCQGLAPRWAYNAGLGARGLRPCSFRNYLKPHCGECLGIGWKWPGTRPKTFYKETRICTQRKCKTNNENVSNSKENNIEQKKEKMDNDQRKSSSENEFENVYNKIHSDQIRDDLKKTSPATNKNVHPNADESSSSNLENFSQKNTSKFLPKNIHRTKSQTILTKDDPYFDEEENYHHVEEQEYEMYDQKYYEREMAHNNEYNEKQTQAHNYMANQNKTNKGDFREIYKNPKNQINSNTDPLFQNALPPTLNETERNYTSDYGGWSKSPTTPEGVIFPQETRQAIRQEFNEMIHNQINPIPIKTHPMSPVSSPRMNYECMCHLDINHPSPVPKKTYDICQTDYDWDGTPQDVTTTHGYDQCCDEESINYRSTCRGPRLQHLVDLFESIGDGRAPPPPPSTPIEQERKYLVSGSPRKYAIASPEQPRNHKRRRRHKKKSPRTTHKHIQHNERYQCPTQRLEWPVYHRCERCEWLHSRM